MKWIGYLCLLAAILGCTQQKHADAPHASSPTPPQMISAYHPDIHYLGLMERTDPLGVRFSWTGSQVRLAVKGAEQIRLHMQHTPLAYDPDSLPWPIFFTLLVDGAVRDRIRIEPGSEPYLLDSLTKSEHLIELFRETEASAGIITFEGISLPSDAALVPPPSLPDRYIAFWGNSLTCGYGNLGEGPDCPYHTETENGYLAYGALVARSLDASYTAVCYSGKGIWRNYDLTQTETLYHLHDRYWPGPDKRRHDLSGRAPDAICINLGTNDFAHSNPPQAPFVKQYLQMIRHLHSVYPTATFFILLGSSLTDQQPSYRRSTLQEYLDVIAKACNSEGIPAFRFDQAPQGKLGYGCDWHPSLAQHEMNAEELVPFIREKMNW